MSVQFPRYLSFLYLFGWRLSEKTNKKKDFQGAQKSKFLILAHKALHVWTPHSTSSYTVLFFKYIQRLVYWLIPLLGKFFLRKLLLLVIQALIYFSVKRKERLLLTTKLYNIKNHIGIG